MDLIADILMVAGTLGAALYCHVLAGRLKSFATLETGMGGAIAVLSAQVDDMTRALGAAREASSGIASRLDGQTLRAEDVAARLELLVAAMHDLPDDAPPAVARPDMARPTRLTPDRRARFVRRKTDRPASGVAE